jgi:hypothetical protein
MRILLAVAFFAVAAITGSAQTLRFSGNVRDTSGQGVTSNVLLMTVRFSDSTLAGFTRSDANGLFRPFTVPKDTYVVILSHPRFSDRTFLVVPSENDTAYNFQNVILPPKSVTLNEVEVIAYRDKSYYKGDTLVFTADSFRTRPNASVEDLLKKLPGFRVDQAGKITIQGKQVDQVLVDGEEFFGTDPTVATRNLNASSVQNVQVYDRKNEDATEGTDETLKVVNLQMKEDSKKGYFGKAAAAGDFQKFYEGELLANRFQGPRKVSLFALGANTPRQAFSGADADQYGLSGEQNWTYDDETNNWVDNRDNRKGIPRTLRSGLYYNDKFGRTKLNTDYTFMNSNMLSGGETNTQFFLGDTTFSNRRVNSNLSNTTGHKFNLKIVSKLDSLTELTVFPKIRINSSDNSSGQTDDFISGSDVLTRQTELNNNSHNESSDLNASVKLSRNFRKKDRNFTIAYQPGQYRSTGTSTLNTTFRYYTADLPDSVLEQRRTQVNFRNDQNATITFTEPLDLKFKAEASYNVNYNRNGSNRQTFDLVTSGNDIFNPILSNNFDNTRLIQRGSARIIYEVKKYRVGVGTALRNVKQENVNLTTGQVLRQNVDNVLPNASFWYKFNQGSRVSLNYNTNSQQPDLQQMQPVRDVSDPNRITEGNPSLRPTFSNNFNLNYYIFKGISDVNFWTGVNYGNTLHQISNSIVYDSLGRAVTKPINVDGSYYGNAWMGGGFPLFNRFIKVMPRANSSISNNVSYINGERVDTRNLSLGPAIELEKETKDYEFELEGTYNYNAPRTTLSARSQQPYYTFGIRGLVMVRLPKKWKINLEGNYTNNGNRTPGYNLNYFILNASVEKSFFETENLVMSVSGNDILNQNIANERIVANNQIIDRKTNVIRRYFLLRVLYKFNSQKKKEGDENDD